MAVIGELVEVQFDLMQEFAREFAEKADSLIDTLSVALVELELPEDPDTTITIPSPTQISHYTSSPPDIPNMPETPSVSTIPEPGVTTISALNYSSPSSPSIANVTTPTASFPNAPSNINVSDPTYIGLSIPTAPTEPIINSINLPSAPELTFPTEPILAELQFPTSPNISLPSFDGTKPSDTDIITPDTFTYNMTVFQESDLWNSIIYKLENDIIDGATGLDADVEAAIYQRHKDRQQVENDKLYQETESMYSATGFNLPTGAMVARLSEVKAEIARKEDDASLDILIKQAELAQNNSQFAITTSIQIGQMLRDFYIQTEDLTFKIALETQNKVIEIYNAQVAFYNLKLEGYKTDAAIYTSLLQGELSKIEIYKSQVTAVGVQADTQKTTVDIYTQKLAALNTQVNIYVTQLEGTKAELSLENLKIESYKALVEAYITELNAESINVEAYKAKIEAENLKVSNYAQQVEAYKASVASESARLQSLIDIERLDLDGSRLKVEKYQAQIQAAIADIQAQAQIAGAQAEISRTNGSNYAALVGAQAEITRANSANYSANVQGITSNYQNEISKYTAEASAKESYNKTLMTEMSAKVQYASALIDSYIKKLDVMSKSYLAIKELQINGETGAMNASAQLASSAMNAVNASAGLQYSSTNSDSTSYSENVSDSFSENYNYSA